MERHETVEGLLGASDVVSLHVPLTAQTRGRIDGRRIAGMKQGAVLVNNARGGIIDEAALAEALGNRRLGGAALDVFTEEPLKAGSALMGVPNLIATPHIAGVTAESNTRISWITVENVAKALGGER